MTAISAQTVNASLLKSASKCGNAFPATGGNEDWPSKWRWALGELASGSFADEFSHSFFRAGYEFCRSLVLDRSSGACHARRAFGTKCPQSHPEGLSNTSCRSTWEGT